MPVYYLRTANNTANTVNIRDAKWATEIVANVPPLFSPAGSIFISDSQFADPSNEFVIDTTSGGASSVSSLLTINVTSNLTIANLSFGAKNTSTTTNSTNCNLNISAGITLIVSTALQLCYNPAYTQSTYGTAGIRLNTNTTGKLSIQGNLYTGIQPLNTGPTPTSNGGSFSAVGGNKSIIEFAGNSTCLIKPNSLGTASANGYFKLLCCEGFGSSTTNAANQFELQINKTGATAFLTQNITQTGIQVYGYTGVTFIINSNYDALAKSSNPGRYDTSAFPFLLLASNGSYLVTTDTKELIFKGLINYNSFGNGLVINNSLSSFKIENIEVRTFLSINNTTTILEVFKNFTALTIGGFQNTINSITGNGTIKFVGTTDTTFTSYNLTSAQYFGSGILQRIGCNIEINKTGGAKFIVNPNITDLNIRRLTVGWPTASLAGGYLFNHVSGEIVCDELYVIPGGTLSAANPYKFIGNSTFNTATKIVMCSSTATNDSNYQINTTSLKCNTLEIIPFAGTPSAVQYIATILGSAGFNVQSFIHTSSSLNALGAINIVTLSGESTAIYTVSNSITMLGLSNRRALLQGNPNNKILSFNASALGTTLTTSTSPALTTRHYISQSPTAGGVSKRTPSVLFTGSDVTLQGSFTKIDANLSPNTWRLNRDVGTINTRPFEAGIPAIFRFTGSASNLNINYATTFDIDSSGATTIKADNSYQNRVGIPLPNMWRTINWDALNPLLPNIIEGYVE